MRIKSLLFVVCLCLIGVSVFSGEKIKPDFDEITLDGVKITSWDNVPGSGVSVYDSLTGRPTINGVVVTGAVLDNGSNYPIIPLANGGTGSDHAAGARMNLGANDASNINDGLLGKAYGGFAEDISAKTGVPYHDNGAVTWDSLVAFLARIGITFTPADNTWVFSAELTAPQIDTTCSYADNNCFVNVGVASPPACTTEREMNSVFDNTTGAWVTCRGGSWVSATATSVAWDNVSDKPALAQVKDFVLKGYSVESDNTTLLWKADQAQTLTALDCMTGGTDNVNVTLYECASDGGTCSTTGLTVTATSAGAADTSASNGSIDADDWVRVYLDTIQGTATYVSCRVKYTVAMP